MAARLPGSTETQGVSDRFDEQVRVVAVVVPGEAKQVPSEIHDAVRTSRVGDERQRTVVMRATVEFDRQPSVGEGEVDSGDEVVAVEQLVFERAAARWLRIPPDALVAARASPSQVGGAPASRYTPGWITIHWRRCTIREMVRFETPNLRASARVMMP